MLNAQIAPSTCSGYNSMNIRLICFFQDNCEKFPNIINPDLMGIMLLQMIRTVSVGQKQANH